MTLRISYVGIAFVLVGIAIALVRYGIEQQKAYDVHQLVGYALEEVERFDLVVTSSLPAVMPENAVMRYVRTNPDDQVMYDSFTFEITKDGGIMTTQELWHEVDIDGGEEPEEIRVDIPLSRADVEALYSVFRRVGIDRFEHIKHDEPQYYDGTASRVVLEIGEDSWRGVATPTREMTAEWQGPTSYLMSTMRTIAKVYQ